MPIARCTLCDATFPVPDFDHESLEDSALGRHLLEAHPDALQMAVDLWNSLEQYEQE